MGRGTFGADGRSDDRAEPRSGSSPSVVRRRPPSSWPSAVIVAASACATPAAGQGAGAEGPIILQTRSTVREAGFNGAGVAVFGDAGALFHNPAGLVGVRHVALEAGFFQAPLDTYQTAGAAAWRLGRVTVGLAVKYFDFGSEPELVPDAGTGGVTGVPTGTRVTASEFLGVGSVAYRVGDLAFGGSARVVRQEVADFTASGATGDVGLAFAPGDRVTFGAALHHLGGNWNGGSPLAIRRFVRAGVSARVVESRDRFRLFSTVEVQAPEGRGTRLVVGLEGGVAARGVSVLARSAYGSRHTDSDRSAVTYGLSLAIARVRLDYAYQPTDLLGDASQRIGLRLLL